MQTNVVPIAHSHIRGSTIPLPKISEAELDARIAENRERFYDSVDPFGEFERWKAERIERRAQPSVIETRPSLLERAIRYGRTFAKSFQHLAVKVVRGLGAPTNSNKGKS